MGYFNLPFNPAYSKMITWTQVITATVSFCMIFEKAIGKRSDDDSHLKICDANIQFFFQFSQI